MLEQSDEESKFEHKKKQVDHKKFLIKKDVDKFASNIRDIESEQRKLLDLKVEFQRLTEKWLAYFRIKNKYSKFNTEKDLKFFLDIISLSESLHNKGRLSLKQKEQNK